MTIGRRRSEVDVEVGNEVLEGKCDVVAAVKSTQQAVRTLWTRACRMQTPVSMLLQTLDLTLRLRTS